MPRPLRNPSRASRLGLVLILSLLACAILGIAHRRSERAGHIDPATGLVRDAALVPAQTITARGGRWFRLHIASAFSGARLAQQNDSLKAQVLTLSAENTQLRAAQIENDRLRALLAFEKRAPRPLLPAEVVALKPSPERDTLILNRGLRQGVHLQQTVIAPSGALVGQVVEMTSRSCTVLLLTDSLSSVGGEIVTRKDAPGAVGICKSDGTGPLRFTDLPGDAEVRPGASVLTSGEGGVFPKNIPIGTVVSVTTDTTNSVKTARMRPAADFDHLEEAFLLQ